MSQRRVTHLSGGCTRGRAWYGLWGAALLPDQEGVDCALCRRTTAAQASYAEREVRWTAQALLWDAIAGDDDPRRTAEALAAMKRLLDQLNCDPVVGVAALGQLADAHRAELEDLVLGERVLRSLGGAA